MSQPLNHMSQNEKNRHKNRPRKWAFRSLRGHFYMRQFFLATNCDANLDENDIADSCRILDIFKLLCDLLCDYFGHSTETSCGKCIVSSILSLSLSSQQVSVEYQNRKNILIVYLH